MADEEDPTEEGSSEEAPDQEEIDEMLEELGIDADEEESESVEEEQTSGQKEAKAEEVSSEEEESSEPEEEQQAEAPDQEQEEVGAEEETPEPQPPEPDQDEEVERILEEAGVDLEEGEGEEAEDVSQQAEGASESKEDQSSDITEPGDEDFPDFDEEPDDELEELPFQKFEGEEGGPVADGEVRIQDRIELLEDVKLDLTVELGRTHKSFREILKLGKDSVVELDKLAGDPLDIYVNDRLVAKGEVIILNDNFCIRITKIRQQGNDDDEEE